MRGEFLFWSVLVGFYIGGAVIFGLDGHWDLFSVMTAGFILSLILVVWELKNSS